MPKQSTTKTRTKTRTGFSDKLLSEYGYCVHFAATKVYRAQLKQTLHILLCVGLHVFVH